MSLNELIKERRSVREFNEKPVSREDINKIIDAAIFAPSWKNSQTGRYYVIDSVDVLKQFREECLGEFNRNNLMQAPAVVITTFVSNRSGFDREGNAENEIGNGWGCYDLGLQTQNLLLMAKELGICTLVMGLRDGDKIRKLLNIPETETLVSIIGVGYSDIDTEQPKRKSVEDITKFF